MTLGLVPESAGVLTGPFARPSRVRAQNTRTHNSRLTNDTYNNIVISGSDRCALWFSNGLLLLLFTETGARGEMKPASDRE